MTHIDLPRLSSAILVLGLFASPALAGDTVDLSDKKNPVPIDLKKYDPPPPSLKIKPPPKPSNDSNSSGSNYEVNKSKGTVHCDSKGNCSK